MGIILASQILNRFNSFPRAAPERAKATRMNRKYQIELEQETDGRWIAEIDAFSEALVYGNTSEQAIMNIEAM